MAQAQIDLIKKICRESVASQANSDNAEFYVQLTSNKYARFYYSHHYKDSVLSLNINKEKSFIIT